MARCMTISSGWLDGVEHSQPPFSTSRIAVVGGPAEGRVPTGSVLKPDTTRCGSPYGYRSPTGREEHYNHATEKERAAGRNLSGQPRGRWGVWTSYNAVPVSYGRPSLRR